MSLLGHFELVHYPPTNLCYTLVVYHKWVQQRREAPGPLMGAKRKAGVLLDASNGRGVREKDVGCVCLLVQEWKVLVEEPAHRNTASLIPAA